MEKWIRIIETNKDDEILEFVKKEFDEKKIKYKIDLEEKWEGTAKDPKYKGNFVVSIEDKFEDETQNILEQYYQNNLIETKEIELSNEDGEYNAEIESEKIKKRQKRIIKIYFAILISIISVLIISTII